MSEDKKQFKDLCEGYTYTPDGTLYSKEDIFTKDGHYDHTEYIPHGKFTPFVEGVQINDDGIERGEEVVLTTLCNFKKGDKVRADAKTINSVNLPVIFGVTQRVFSGKGHISHYKDAILIQCEKISPVARYTHTGYTLIDGKRVFLNGNYSVSEEGLTDSYNVEMVDTLNRYSFTNEKHEERYKTLLNELPSVLPSRIAFPGLGYVFLTPLNALLREVRLEPNFTMFFTGRTNSFKTSTACLFVNFFGDYFVRNVPVSVTNDTPNNMERKFAVLDSTLVVADDVIPGNNAKQRLDMENKIQAIVRKIGDRVGRGRLNSDSGFKSTYISKCNVIITAEESYTQVGESALSRTITVEFLPGEINSAKLQGLQSRSIHLNECMTEYIQFVIGQWEHYKEELPSKFYEYRALAQSHGLPRLAETVSYLQIGIYVMCEWLVAIEILSPEQSKELQAKSWEIFTELALKQSRLITEEKPVKLFLDAIREMRDRGLKRFLDIEENNTTKYNSLSENILGYCDSEFYYCNTGVYTAVRQYYQDQGTCFPLSKQGIYKQLVDEKLVVPGKNQTTQEKTVNGRSFKLLWLKKTALDGEGVNNDLSS